MKRTSHRREDNITWQDFNRVPFDRRLGKPERDSPGDSALDEAFEIGLGLNFYSDEEIDDDTDSEEEINLDVTPSHPKKEIRENSRVESSFRPDPKDDMNSKTSTH